MAAIDELGSLNQFVSDKGKAIKILHTPHISFDALAMASSSSTNTFEEVVNAVSANIKKRKKGEKWKQTGSDTVALIVQIRTTRGGFLPRCGFGRERFCELFKGRGGNFKQRAHQHSNGKVFHYCRKAEYFINFHRLCIVDEAHGQVVKPNSHRVSNPQIFHWGAPPLPCTGSSFSTPHGYYTAASFSSAAHERGSPALQPTNHF